MSAYSHKRTFASYGNQFLSVGAFDPTRGGPCFQSADQLAHRRGRQAQFAACSRFNLAKDRSARTIGTAMAQLTVFQSNAEYKAPEEKLETETVAKTRKSLRA